MKYRSSHRDRSHLPFLAHDDHIRPYLYNRFPFNAARARAAHAHAFEQPQRAVDDLRHHRSLLGPPGIVLRPPVEHVSEPSPVFGFEPHELQRRERAQAPGILLSHRPTLLSALPSPTLD